VVHPVSIIVPHPEHRAWFFERFCLPSLEANNPAEVIIESQGDGAAAKRNAGATRATQPFLLFVDDDLILAHDCVERLLSVLTVEPDVGYAYCDYATLIWPGVEHPRGDSYIQAARPFDEPSLRHRNYIPNSSLLRREAFCGYDEELARFQDWDLWLTLLGSGVRGVYVPETLFISHVIDIGITGLVPEAEALRAVRMKHGLPKAKPGSAAPAWWRTPRQLPLRVLLSVHMRTETAITRRRQAQ
jgi:hypothetical protein